MSRSYPSHLLEHYLRAIAARWLQHLAASCDSSSCTPRVPATRVRVRNVGRVICAAQGLGGAEGRARQAGLCRGSQPARSTLY